MEGRVPSRPLGMQQARCVEEDLDTPKAPPCVEMVLDTPKPSAASMEGRVPSRPAELPETQVAGMVPGPPKTARCHRQYRVSRLGRVPWRAEFHLGLRSCRQFKWARWNSPLRNPRSYRYQPRVSRLGRGHGGPSSISASGVACSLNGRDGTRPSETHADATANTG